jgi:hypothetical protein
VGGWAVVAAVVVAVVQQRAHKGRLLQAAVGAAVVGAGALQDSAARDS